MLGPLVLVFGLAISVQYVAGCDVRIQALNANDGRQAGGERVVACGSSWCSLKPYDRPDDEQVWKRIYIPNSNVFYICRA